MRQKVCEALVARAAKSDMVFLTGDLGFMALEPLQERLGDRFINCGVAEQNMLTVAAAMAKEKLDVWIYTIAPFCYARAFEQIRNDICLHTLPVKMLCNGGGFGYGVMGPTHHAVEDYGVLATLPGLQIFTPAVLGDIHEVITLAGSLGGPSYIRLGRDERPKNMMVPPYATWRRVMAGDGPVVISLGPIVGPLYQALTEISVRPEFWIIGELPLLPERIPAELVQAIVGSGRLCVVEEHVKHGGLGSMLCQWLVESAIDLKSYRHLHVRGGAVPLVGSQEYMRRQNGLSQDAIRVAVQDLLKSG